MAFRQINKRTKYGYGVVENFSGGKLNFYKNKTLAELQLRNC